jgi:hypothetical protein
MADVTIEELVEKIEEHDLSALAAISALTARRVVDARNRTLFDLAILSARKKQGWVTFDELKRMNLGDEVVCSSC